MLEVDLEDRYALETRAQVLKLVSASDAVRRGETDRTEVGGLASSDAVAGQETLQVGGNLRENAHAQVVKADRLQTEVAGQLKLHTHSDTTLLGGAMAETHAGAVLLTAGMSDSLVAGGGMRATALVDLWLAGLAGLEEKIGSANADGALIEAYGTHFEREYGPGNHVAGFANFSGTVHTTTATGFRPLYKVASGVRNLTAGGGGGAGPEGPTGPAAPPEPVPPPAAGTPPNDGLLGQTPEVADAGRGVGDLSASADPADVADAARNLPAAPEGGRSSQAAEELTRARYLTMQEVDDTLARVRAGAALPDEESTQNLYAFVENLPRTEAEDAAYGRAATATHAKIQDAVEPFRAEFGVALQFDLEGAREFEGIAGLREAIASNAADARAAGDIGRAGELAGVLIGFDDLVYQHVTELLGRFPDVAEVGDFQDGLKVALKPSFPPPRYAPAALVDGFDKVDVVDQLQLLRANWLDEGVRNQALETGADLAALAADEVARGNHPAAALDAQLELWRHRAGGTGIEGQADVLQNAIEQIKEVVEAGTAAADRSREAGALLQSFQARRIAAQDAENWEALVLLAEAEDDLIEHVLDLRDLTTAEHDALRDLDDAVAIREALLRLRDGAQNPQVGIRLGAVLADYDGFVRSFVGELLNDVDALANPSALAHDVDRAGAIGELRALQQGTAPLLTRLEVDDDLLLVEDSYLKAYSYAAGQIAVGKDPLRGLNADIAKVQYTIRSIDDADELRTLETRLRRLQQVRDLVQRAIETHRGRQAPRSARLAGISDDVASAADGWQALRASDGLQDAQPPDLHFEGAVVPPEQLQDRTAATVAGNPQGPGVHRAAPMDGAGLSASGDYPPLIAPLPSDVARDALVDALTDEIVRLTRTAGPSSDRNAVIRRSAFATAVAATEIGEHPIVQIDAIAEIAGASPGALEVLQEVRTRVIELINEHRLAVPPVAQYDDAGAGRQVVDLQRQTLAAPDEAKASSSTSRSSSDYVASPPSAFHTSQPSLAVSRRTDEVLRTAERAESLDLLNAGLSSLRAPPEPGTIPRWRRPTI